MKVILLRDVRTVGRKGDIKEVSEGYARNFLFPQKFAQPATEGAVKHLSEQEAHAQAQKINEQKKYKLIVDQLAQSPLTFKIKIGEKGKAFGSVTTREIHEALKKKNIVIEKDWIMLEEPIKTTGEKHIPVQFPLDVTGSIQITVTPE